jgi:hypothetical protein
MICTLPCVSLNVILLFMPILDNMIDVVLSSVGKDQQEIKSEIEALNELANASNYHA